MNVVRKRRLPVNIAASILVLIVSVVTAQQVFDGNRQPAFVRRQPFLARQPQPVFQQNQNFIRVQPRQQQQQFFVQRRPPQPAPQQRFRFQPQQPQPQFQQQRLQRVQNVVPTRAPPPPQFSFRPPLAPMPFGSVQRPFRRPQPRVPAPRRPSTLPPTTQAPPLPTSTSLINSVGGPLRRPIRVQQLQLNLRRKPQMTRGHSRSSAHTPTHRVLKPARITRPTTTTTEATTTMEETSSAVVSGTTPEGIHPRPDVKKVDDIEAAILQAVLDSQTTTSQAPPPSRRPRIRRPGHQRRRPLAPPSPPRVDTIEEAVLRAVLEATPAISEEAVTEEPITSPRTTTEEPTTTTQATESTSLFPAFATRRHTRRRQFSPTTVIPTTVISSTSTPEEALNVTTSIEEPVTTTTSTEESTPVVTSSEILEGTTPDLSRATIALPEENEGKEEFENIEAKKEQETEIENHQLHLIEENVIAALSTPTSSTPTPPSPIPPSPLPPSSSPPSGPSPPSSSPPHEFQAGPPGSMPPSDDIVDELNGSSDFLQVAQRLHLLRRLLQ